MGSVWQGDDLGLAVCVALLLLAIATDPAVMPWWRGDRR
jgi:hypothetical protein